MGNALMRGRTLDPKAVEAARKARKERIKHLLKEGGKRKVRKVISLKGKARQVFALLAMAAKRDPGKTLKEM